MKNMILRIGRARSWSFVAVAFCLLAVLATPVRLVAAAEAAVSVAAASEADAAKAGAGWAAIIDEGRYAESWKTSGKLFQASLTVGQWEAALNQVRKPLGGCKERKFSKAETRSTLPGPKGDTLKGNFVILQFRTNFAELPAAIETLTVQKEADGAWRAIGYFIRPAQ